MGMWGSSKIVFGFDLGEGIPKEFVFYHGEDEQPLHEGDVDNAFAEWGANQLGVPHPGYFRKRDGMSDIQWEKYEQAITQFFNECPVTILTYYSYSKPKYFLGLKETVQSGSDSTPKKINTYVVDEKILKDFCEKYSLPYQEPSWNMISLYG